ncbi:hypothetical protein BCON_0214g00010 [Botryotinia convoluta]|uniref:Uncharacterized protein n=1 Tax=Botryotinia convoluta TaxID=54673 RepID=A0A4Z1HJN8_9HELO|nr:hypothetical protein BCON_0214g00010 [Botryotinia convoluta]
MKTLGTERPDEVVYGSLAQEFGTIMVSQIVFQDANLKVHDLPKRQVNWTRACMVICDRE